MEAASWPVSRQPNLLVNLAATTGVSILSLPEFLPRQNRLTWVTGPAGVGKTVHALDAALNGVRAGRHVVVFGAGHPIRTLARLTGGSLSRLMPDGSFARQLSATRAAEVFDLGSCAYAPSTCKPARSPIQLDRAADRQSLLVVDDFNGTARLVTDLPRFLVQSLQSGSSAVVTSRDQISEEDRRSLRQLLEPLQVPMTRVTITRDP